MTKGIYIVIEGPEGAGKSTAAERLVNDLNAMGYDAELTREPGGTPLAENIRTILKAVREEKVDPLTEILLFSASRRQNFARRLIPALDAGKIVVSDRSCLSMLAYQGFGHGMLKETTEMIDLIYRGVPLFDLVLLLDVPVAVSRERAEIRALGTDRIEAEGDEFFERVRSGYLDIKKNYFSDVDKCLIDATRGASVVYADVLEAALDKIHSMWGDKKNEMERSEP